MTGSADDDDDEEEEDEEEEEEEKAGSDDDDEEEEEEEEVKASSDDDDDDDNDDDDNDDDDNDDDDNDDDEEEEDYENPDTDDEEKDYGCHRPANQDRFNMCEEATRMIKRKAETQDNAQSRAKRHRKTSSLREYEVRMIKNVWSKDGVIFFEVAWADGTTSEEPWTNLMNCQELIRNFRDYILDYDPTKRALRNRTYDPSIGDREVSPPEEYAMFKHVDAYPFQQSKKRGGNCLQDAISNAINRLSNRRTPQRVFLDNPTYTGLEKYLRKSPISIVRRHRFTNQFAHQHLPPGNLYIGIAVTNDMQKHAVVIDYRTNTCILADSSNPGPVRYNRRTTAWVKHWTRMYIVKMRDEPVNCIIEDVPFPSHDLGA